MQQISLSALFALIHIPIPHQEIVKGVSVDSRKIALGEIFFALPGQRVDGHHFLQEVASKGALGAVVLKTYQGPAYGLHLIHVDDVLATLQQLAKVFLARQNPKIVGITGSLGKTTTKEFITTLLKARYRTASTVGSANGQIGLPLTILNQSDDEEVFVLEMGMSMPGELSRLANLIPPDIAVITTVSLIHAIHFNGLEHIALTKAELFAPPHVSIGVYNADMPYASLVSQVGACQKKQFSVLNSDADYFIELQGGVACVYHRGEKQIEVPWHIRGKHNLSNYLAAVVVARQMELSWKEIADFTKQLKLPSMRLESIEKKGVHFINDAYNANVESMTAALISLPEPSQGGRRFGILGDMKELGRLSPEAHQSVHTLALTCLDQIFYLGQEWLHVPSVHSGENSKVSLFKTRKELVAEFRKLVQPGDVVLLKGGRPHNLQEVVNEFATCTA